jgi:hypothetical protein
VSELGRLLECLHGAHDRVGTLQAEFRDWQSLPASSRVVADLGGESPRFRWRDGGPWVQAAQTRRRLWLEEPGRLRVELFVGESLTRVGIRIGGLWWRWDRAQGVIKGEPAGAPRRRIPPLLDPPLLAPARLLGLIRLEPAGVGERAGRRVLLARAKLRESQRTPEELSFELEFDAENGTMLRMAAFEQERCVQLTEALMVCYDAPIDAAQFSIREKQLEERFSGKGGQPPAGTRVQGTLRGPGLAEAVSPPRMETGNDD